MRPQIVPLVFLMFVIGGMAGCSRHQPVTEKAGAVPTPPVSPPNWPEPGSPTKLDPGVLFYEVTLTRGTEPVRVWIYLPEGRKGKVPAILIAPAGSPLVHGMRLGKGDRPEHLPYVRAGFAVIAYDIEGQVWDDATRADLVKAIKTFETARYGVADAQLALDYALARVPQIDADRIIAAGHSSAATLALLVAASDSRIKGCLAYAPAPDVAAQLPQQNIDFYSKMIQNFSSFMHDSSPVNHIAELRCPIFLFHADDDSIVPSKAVADFAERLKVSNPNVTLSTVASGDHYDSMIKAGIPNGIRWAMKLPGFSPGSGK